VGRDVKKATLRDADGTERKIDRPKYFSLGIIVPHYGTFACSTCNGTGEGWCKHCKEPHCQPCWGTGESNIGEVRYELKRGAKYIYEEVSRTPSFCKD